MHQGHIRAEADRSAAERDERTAMETAYAERVERFVPPADEHAKRLRGAEEWRDICARELDGVRTLLAPGATHVGAWVERAERRLARSEKALADVEQWIAAAALRAGFWERHSPACCCVGCLGGAS
jgi:hypothetical protein